MSVNFNILRLSDRLSTGLELGESHFREFKSAVDNSPPAPKPRDAKAICRDIGETLVAFANADGGELFVGVEDDLRVTGVPHADHLTEMMLDAPKNYVHGRTPLPSPNVARLTHDDKRVLYFQVAKSTSYVHLTSEGKCLQRFDRENRPVPAEDIQYSRQEQKSREYDRGFVDGAGLHDLNLDLVDAISKHIAGGQSPEKFLQYMDLAEYASEGLLRLRRAALLLFAREIVEWHPKCEVRIVRVSGTTLGVGHGYNVDPRDDITLRGNVLHIVENVWDRLRPYLARTKLVAGIFKESLIYPEDACKEALFNAVAHRDYSLEGRGMEIFVYDDRMEIKSPGGLLSSISIADLRAGKRTHQSRNVYVARVLRELGYMREMGEGMLRIFTTMRDLDLVPPELEADGTRFDVVLHHRSVFSPQDQDWLEAYSLYNLSRDEQRVALLGRDGHLLSTTEIVKALAIVDTDQFRQLVERLRRKGILYNALPRGLSRVALRVVGSKREVGRFSVRQPHETEQYREELMRLLRNLGPRSYLSGEELKHIAAQLSPSSPYREALADSLKLLGLADERLRPLPVLAGLWQGPQAAARTVAPEPREAEALAGEVKTLRPAEGYGFIRVPDQPDYFFHRSSLVESADWQRLTVGMRVSLHPAERRIPGKAPAAKRVTLRG